MEGDYVSFVREPNAEEDLDEIRICNFGVIADPDIIVSQEVEEEEELITIFEMLKQLFDAQYP